MATLYNNITLQITLMKHKSCNGNKKNALVWVSNVIITQY